MSASISGDLESELDEFMEEMKDGVEGKIKGIAKLFYKYQSDDKVGSVPVDTGRYRNSWNASVNTKDTSHPPVSNQHSANQFPVPDFELQGDFELGDTIHLTNAVPYARKLNQDLVRQVPKHFFETNFESVLNIPTGTIPRED